MDLKEEIEKTSTEISELKIKLAALKLKEAQLEVLKNDLNFLKKKDTELPPGFEIKWYHRHDPFNSVYALWLHNEYYCMASDSDGEGVQFIKLRKKAWELFEMAVKILGDKVYGNN